jgi:hypothetical protein
MTEENKELKVVFAPGAFDSFEGTQEELDEIIAEVQAMFEGKTKEEIQSMSRSIDLQELAEDEDISDEEFERIASIVLEDINKPRNLQ